MHTLALLWSHLVDWTSAHAVVPVAAALHAGAAADDAREIAQALLIACLQVFLIACVMRPLESVWPHERWEDRELTTVDRQYTLVMLGLFPLFSYLALRPFADLFAGGTAAAGPGGLREWFPWFAAHPLAAFLAYYAAYDLCYYWMHRAQHAIPWWWALHSMHHSQRQMSCWTNDRGSYLDGVLQSFVLSLVGIALGVEPSEFALLVLLSELVQNLSHANLRLQLGSVSRWAARIWVGPRFHRLHHMRRDPDRPALHNCNFGQVLSVWDSLFGTALHGEPVRPTGVSDPVVDADNGRGLVAMQWHTLKRFWAAVRHLEGWRLGDVHFGGPGLRPVHDDGTGGVHAPGEALVQPPTGSR
ncbi:sterol desaturase family protein [Ramlibacter humi]|uniref:Sterol desaturase family protein n=1 Tax=Ramlibacter humi TaxID=2530451 RepID=A0A4Z0CCA3_9BURK|nr:sterol desaturase family protein [Ramlibacter humi]TFZ07719.1 sterol desaturase family protein [Ramlibacter humi]